MEHWIQDLRIGWRNLRNHAGFSLLAIVTLGLGIGFNSAIFSVVNTVLLAPLPYPEPESLVWMWGRNSSNDRAKISPPDFLDYQERNQVLRGLVAFTGVRRSLGEGESGREITVTLASAEYFTVLGVDAFRGRVDFPRVRSDEDRAVCAAS